MKDKTCYCGSNIIFRNCCAPVLDDHHNADTPEKLMRSRYTAFVLRDEQHLLRTWVPSSRPKGTIVDNETVWLKLTIHNQQIADSNSNYGEVTFTADYVIGTDLFQLTEKSNFVRRAGLWYYVDGENSIRRESIGKKPLCPCGSGKKFKRCCYHNGND